MARLMGRLEKLFALAAVALLGVAGAAQPPPDFSGRWTAVPMPREAAVAGADPGRGGRPSAAGGAQEFTRVAERAALTVEARSSLIKTCSRRCDSPMRSTAPRTASPTTWAEGRPRGRSAGVADTTRHSPLRARIDSVSRRMAARRRST